MFILYVYPFLDIYLQLSNKLKKGWKGKTYTISHYVDIFPFIPLHLTFPSIATTLFPLPYLPPSPNPSSPVSPVVPQVVKNGPSLNVQRERLKDSGNVSSLMCLICWRIISHLRYPSLLDTSTLSTTAASTIPHRPGRPMAPRLHTKLPYE